MVRHTFGGMSKQFGQEVDLVTEAAGAGPSVNCTAEDAATLASYVAVADYIALSANPRSLESAMKACSNAQGDNRVWTVWFLTNDVFTVSSAEGRWYRLAGFSIPQRE
jgi:hypothetical protein